MMEGNKIIRYKEDKNEVESVEKRENGSLNQNLTHLPNGKEEILCESKDESLPDYVKKGYNNNNYLVSELLTNTVKNVRTKDLIKLNHETLLNIVKDLNHAIEFKKEIPRILANKNEIKATVLVFVLRWKVIYVSFLSHLFQGEEKNFNSFKKALESLERKQFLQKIDNHSHLFQSERRSIENALFHLHKIDGAHIQKIKWFVITEEAQMIIPDYIGNLLDIIPDNIRKRATTESIKGLFREPTQKAKAEMEIRAKNEQINEIVEQISLIRYNTRNNSLQVRNEINEEFKASGEDRLTIAKRKLSEERVRDEKGGIF